MCGQGADDEVAWTMDVKVSAWRPDHRASCHTCSVRSPYPHYTQLYCRFITESERAISVRRKKNPLMAGFGAARSGWLAACVRGKRPVGLRADRRQAVQAPRVLHVLDGRHRDDDTLGEFLYERNRVAQQARIGDWG